MIGLNNDIIIFLMTGLNSFDSQRGVARGMQASPQVGHGLRISPAERVSTALRSWAENRVRVRVRVRVGVRVRVRVRIRV